MEHDIPFGNSNRENGTTFLDFPLFLGIFQWDEPTKRVPFTAELEIPEILTKWKAPQICYQLSKYCAPFARARESSTEKVSQVKFSFSMVNEVMIQPDWLLEAKALLWPIYYPDINLNKFPSNLNDLNNIHCFTGASFIAGSSSPHKSNRK